jgi:16S rRNA (cytosine967-C5)-methyltransferase
MTPTRNLAVTTLTTVFDKGAKPRDVLDSVSSGLDRRDRSFLMELVYGVLRHRDYLDWILAGFLKTPAKLHPQTLNNLRTAVYQIRYMRVPEWAVVNEAVESEKERGGKPPLVNAVLRNYLRRKDAITVPPADDPVEHLSIVTSHPRWLIRRWIKRFGYDESARLAQKNNEIPPHTLRMADAAQREQALTILKDKGVSSRLTHYSPSGIIVEGPISFAELEELLPFPFFVQDEASQLISFLLDPRPGERVLDACAAPGGKATHMAQLMKGTGEITAVEVEEKRIPRIQNNIARLGIHCIKVLLGDVRDMDKLAGCGDCLFDRILLDAPCSALGVVRRNPDVKYRQTANDLIRLRKNQADLLRSVSRYLRVGGIMVYSVCSTEPEEGEEVLRAFLQDNRTFSIIEGDYDFLKRFEITYSEGAFYRTFPHKDEMDGFFAARLRRER